jgi:hypothetical protein
MSFTNPNETFDEAEARWAANRATKSVSEYANTADVVDVLFATLQPLPNKAWGNFRPTARMGEV